MSEPKAAQTLSTAAQLPGLDVVGHGIQLRPHFPYELRGVLFPRRGERTIAMRDADAEYALPDGYDIDHSPPMPAGQLLNQVKIEESWDRFQKHLSLDANVASGNGSFSVSATNATQMRADEDAYYAVRTSFIPLWSVYLSDAGNYLPELDRAEIPTPFKFSHRRAYECGSTTGASSGRRGSAGARRRSRTTSAACGREGERGL